MLQQKTTSSTSPNSSNQIPLLDIKPELSGFDEMAKKLESSNASPFDQLRTLVQHQELIEPIEFARFSDPIEHMETFEGYILLLQFKTKIQLYNLRTNKTILFQLPKEVTKIHLLDANRIIYQEKEKTVIQRFDFENSKTLTVEFEYTDSKDFFIISHDKIGISKKRNADYIHFVVINFSPSQHYQILGTICEDNLVEVYDAVDIGKNKIILHCFDRANFYGATRLWVCDLLSYKHILSEHIGNSGRVFSGFDNLKKKFIVLNGSIYVYDDRNVMARDLIPRLIKVNVTNAIDTQIIVNESGASGAFSMNAPFKGGLGYQGYIYTMILDKQGVPCKVAGLLEREIDINLHYIDSPHSFSRFEMLENKRVLYYIAGESCNKLMLYPYRKINSNVYSGFFPYQKKLIEIVNQTETFYNQSLVNVKMEAASQLHLLRSKLETYKFEFESKVEEAKKEASRQLVESKKEIATTHQKMEVNFAQQQEQLQKKIEENYKKNSELLGNQFQHKLLQLQQKVSQLETLYATQLHREIEGLTKTAERLPLSSNSNNSGDFNILKQELQKYSEKIEQLEKEMQGRYKKIEIDLSAQQKQQELVSKDSKKNSQDNSSLLEEMKNLKETINEQQRTIHELKQTIYELQKNINEQHQTQPKITHASFWQRPKKNIQDPFSLSLLLLGIFLIFERRKLFENPSASGLIFLAIIMKLFSPVTTIENDKNSGVIKLSSKKS